jgi:hypothetical protein
MPGLLDMLNAQPNTTGSGNTDPLTSLLQGGTPQNAAPQSLMTLLQGMFGAKQPNAPPYGDAGFNSLPFQSSPEQLTRMLQLQSLIAKEPQPPSPYGESGFASPGFQPSPEQAARIQQLSQIFPQSRNVVDVRSVPQFYPRQLPLQAMGTGLQNALIQNPQWPMPGRPPMQRYPGQ